MDKGTKIIILVTALTVIAIAGLIWLGGKKPTGEGQVVDGALLVKPDSHMTGRAGAKVTLVEFGDYQCPACGYFEPIVKQVRDAHKDNPNFNFVFRNFPLPQHKNAVAAAEAAEAAGAQGKYWEMHELLYMRQTDWAESGKAKDIFVGYAQTLKLNADDFKTALDRHTFTDFIDKDKTDGESINVNATPTFYLNGQKLANPPSTPEQFKQLIDQNLSQ